MKTIRYPDRKSWTELVSRPSDDNPDLLPVVQKIIERVKYEGDTALFDFSIQFDKVQLNDLKVSRLEIENAIQLVKPDLKNAISQAKANIEKFHLAQKYSSVETETSSGVNCYQKSLPIEKVGLYIPGGTAPLFSTVLMLGVPAKIAGCKQICLCTPPDREGKINPAILYTADLIGIDTIFKVGGAQAIASMAYGTESIPQSWKIFGPGNQFVTLAKQVVSLSGTAIDMPAGPSEVLVIADDSSVPSFVAADLLSQAEHGADSQVLLVTSSENIIDSILSEISRQLGVLPRRKIALKALNNSSIILLKDEDEIMDFTNSYAPEHLIIATKNARILADRVTNAGSVFIGNYTPESAGDYASGTNHTLPTGGFSKMYSGLGTESFCKKITFQEISKQGLNNIGHTIELMAEAEGLDAHKRAVSVRLDYPDVHYI